MVIAGQKINRLTAIKVDHKKEGRQYWLFQCECGNFIVRRPVVIEKGNTKSCGCLMKDYIKKITIHGDAKGSKRSRLNRIFAGIHSRCYTKNNPKYKNYGARGIKVCNEWLNYSNFKKWALHNGYNENLTIERINVDGNYEPLNCKWIPASLQAVNRTSSRIYTIGNKTQCVSQWAKEYNLKPRNVLKRLNVGYSIEESLNKNHLKAIPPFTITYLDGVSKKYKSTSHFAKKTKFSRNSIATAWNKKKPFYVFKQGKMKGLIVHFEPVGQP